MISDAIEKQLSDVIQSGDKKMILLNLLQKNKMVDTQTMLITWTTTKVKQKKLVDMKCNTKISK